MARIIGGIGTSHVPTIGVAYDKGKRDDPAWAPLFKGYEPVARWLAAKEPDVLVFFYNDPRHQLFLRPVSDVALGVSPRFALPDEGAGRRPLPDIHGHPGLAIHLAESLVNDEFDLAPSRSARSTTAATRRCRCCGRTSPIGPARWVPFAINVLQYPLPTAMRCYKLGQAVRRAVESYPEDLRVVVVGTGGLSHQIHGERTGFNNTEWDMRFLDLIERDPMTLARMRHAEYIELGGAEGVEVIMWLAMRGALSDGIRKLHQTTTSR
jgi:hypothetical protein